MRDVAERAGVHPSVVSRVINDDPRLAVSEATRRRILESIATLGYRPNITARSLRAGRSYLVGLLVPDFTNPVYADVVSGASEAAEAFGYHLMLGSGSPAQWGEAWLHRLLDEGRVDGILIASSVMEDAAATRLATRNPLVVLVNRLATADVGAVVVDDARACRLATEHLFELGHRDIGLVVGPAGVDTARRRLRGFLAAHEAAMIDAGPVVWSPTTSAEDGHRAMAALLDAHPGITGVVASTLLLAIGALGAIRGSGRTVPADVSVVTVNDSELARYSDPPLTTVAMPFRQLGGVAFRELMRRLGGEVSTGTIVVDDPPPRLVVRMSTSAPR